MAFQYVQKALHFLEKVTSFWPERCVERQVSETGDSQTLIIMSDSIVRVPVFIFLGMEVSLRVQSVAFARPTGSFLELIVIPFPCLSDRNSELRVCFSGGSALPGSSKDFRFVQTDFKE